MVEIKEKERKLEVFMDIVAVTSGYFFLVFQRVWLLAMFICTLKYVVLFSLIQEIWSALVSHN